MDFFWRVTFFSLIDCRQIFGQKSKNCVDRGASRVGYDLVTKPPPYMEE